MKRLLLLISLLMCVGRASATLDPAVLQGLASDDFDARQAAVASLAAAGDDADAQRLLKALSEDAAAVAGGRSVIASRRSSICTFIVFSVDSVMRCTSSAWMVAPSMRAFCSSQNCTVRNSSMRFSSSSGFSVGATH